MTRVSLLAAAFLAAASPAAMANHGPGRDASAVLTAGTVTMVLPPPQFTRVYERVVNVGTSGVAWCSRVSNHPAPNAAGSFPLAPFGDSLGRPSSEEFVDRFDTDVSTPQAALYCTADSGTATLSAEISIP